MCGYGLRNMGRMKVLVIEDDDKTRAALCQSLVAAGFDVDARSDGAEGLSYALAAPALDLIVLDVALPTLDGWSVMSAVREQGRQTPVIMLTARDTVEQRVRGLKLGADDYLIKPFAVVELLARIETILRRVKPVETVCFQIADLKLDSRRHEVVRGGTMIELSSKEFSVLELLLRHRGEVLSRTFIASRVWDMELDTESNVIDVNIRRLRAKVDDPFAQKLIHTIRGRGYVIR